MATAGATGVAGLAGCSGGSDGGTTGTVTGDGSDGSEGSVTLQWAASSQEKDVSDQIVEALRDAGMPDRIDISFLAGGNVSNDRRSQYNRWLSADRAKPDLLRMDSGWTIPFIAREQLMNLSESLGDEFTTRVGEDYFDMAVNTASDRDGALYALPLWVGLPTMLYRKDLVESAGYSPESENWATESISWETFSHVTRDVLDENDDLDYGYTFQASDYEGLSCCNFNEFMTSWGGAYFGNPEEHLFGPVGDRPVTVDDPQVVDAVRMVRTFINGDDDEHSLDGYAGDISPDAVLQWTEPTSAKPFTNGNAVMLRNWPYFVNVNGSPENFGEDLGVMPIPYGMQSSDAEYPSTGGPVAALGGWHLAANPNTEHESAVLEVMKAASKDSFNLALFDILGQIPPKPAALDREEARDIPVMGRYLDTLKVAGENAIPRPVTSVWPDQSTQIYQAVNGTLGQEQPPEAALSDLSETLTQIENSL
ncbi:sugar ABC transporter substrate-binding protein [Halobacteriales archaeon QS_6_71_20]|nr:MAG: sugar ABC transporter substrate-binding protein [Halobacteriales archaeon QS_6_71_20]